MPLSVNFRNESLDAMWGVGAASGTFISLHNGDPTVTLATALANELVGGPYARQQLNLAAAAGGAKNLAADVVVPIQAGDQFSHYALWKVGAAGAQPDLKGSAPLNQAEGVYGNDGTYRITSIPLTM